MAIWTNNNATYYINPAYLSFNENSGYGANLIQVSASSSCYISVFDPANGIDYSDVDKNYMRWKVTAYNNKFPDRDKFYIYVRLDRKGTSALIVYDKILRGVHGGVIIEKTDEQGNVIKEEGDYNENHIYYYIHIGEVSETDGRTIREIAYDTGYLTSNKSNDDKAGLNDMWELDKYSTPWLIKAKQWLSSFTVKGIVKLVGGLSFSKGKDGDEKTITDVATSADKENEEIISDSTVPTTAWVSEKFAGITDDRYLRKDQDDETEFSLSVGGTLSVADKLTASQDVEVNGNLSVGGDSAVSGTMSVGTNATIEGNASVGGALFVADKLTASQDAEVKGNLSVVEDLSVKGESHFADNVNVKTSLVLKEKPIAQFTRYQDEDKPLVSTDVAFYSALMTDKRIEEELAELDDKYLRKDVEDTAHKEITFEEGVTVYQLAKMMNIEVSQLATIAQAVIKAGEGFSESISSADFVDGFFGEGFRIWHDLAAGNWNMTLDNLTVRKAMMIYELIIQKIRSVGGVLVVSAGNGRIKEVEKIGLEYKITFEDTNTFVEHDLMRCQVFSKERLKNYWVEVYRVFGENVYVRTSEFSDQLPEAGDEVVLMGNTKNKLRQNLIVISASEDGQPRFDCLDGVNTRNFENCLKVRVGALDGIRDDRFPAEMQPKGYGLYGNNCYLTGVFVLSTGVDVNTQFSIMEGMIRSEVSSVRAEINAKDNYLSNASFSENLNFWEFENNVRVFDTSGGLLYFNDEFYSDKRVFAGVVAKDSKNVLRIKNSYIRQRNENFGLKPTFDLYDTVEKDENGNEVVVGKKYRPRMFYVSFKYMVAKGGVLRVYFESEQNDGSFEDYKPIDVNDSISETMSFSILEKEGKWNGTGDFYLSFTGDIYIYDLALSDNALADVEEKFSSLIEQTDKKIQVNLDYTKGKLEEYHAELILTAKGLESTFTKKLTDQYSKITNEYSSSISQTAEEIRMKVSALETDLNGKITDANSSITQTANSIRLEVSKLETDLNGQISDAKSSITQTAEEIRLEVSELETDLNGKIAAANSSITQTANSIRLEVSELETNLNGQISEAKSSITQTADEIRAEVSESIKNLEDGLVADYESQISLTAQGLRSEFSSDLTDLETGLTSSYKSAISQSAKEIRADLSSIEEDLDGRIKTNETNISIQAGQIKSITSSVEKLDATVLSHTTSINQNTKAIELKASKDSVDKLTGRVSAAESSITITADELNAFTQKITFDSNGNITNFSKSGLYTTSNRATLYSSLVKDGLATTASLSSYVLETELGTLVSKIEISADQIDLSGVVTFDMLNGELQDELDGKATSSALTTAKNELDKSISTLNSTISGLQTEVGKKASIDSLNSKVAELNNALSAKLSGSVTAVQDKITSAVIGGSTLISGGYIHTDYIKAEDLEVGALRAASGSYTYTLDANGFAISSDTGAHLCDLYVNDYYGYFRMSRGTDYFSMDGLSLMYLSSGGLSTLSGAGLSLSSGAAITGLALGNVHTSGITSFSDFVVMSSNYSLPAASSCKGKVIFIRFVGKRKLTGSIIPRNSGTSVRSVEHENKSAFYISNGTNWYEFFCYYS